MKVLNYQRQKYASLRNLLRPNRSKKNLNVAYKINDTYAHCSLSELYNMNVNFCNSSKI